MYFIFSSHPICVSFPPSAICNHGHSRLPLSSRSLFSPRLSDLRDILFRQEHLLQKKKILIVFLHTRLHEQTEKQANRQLLTKKNPLEADSLF